MPKIAVITLFVAGCALSLGNAARADQSLFTASVGTRSASALFDATGSTLTVTLTNTSAFDALMPIDVLTAVFFDVDGAPLSLTRSSAVLGLGSTVLFGAPDPGGVVGGEWSYADGLSGAPQSAGYGISSSGFGLFGDMALFPGNNLQGPTSPDGLQFGITSAGDLLGTGNAAVTGANALIQNSVVFTLSGLPVGFSTSSIHNVSFQYGTALDEPNIPAPGSLALLALGAAAAFRRRR